MTSFAEHRSAPVTPDEPPTQAIHVGVPAPRLAEVCGSCLALAHFWSAPEQIVIELAGDPYWVLTCLCLCRCRCPAILTTTLPVPPAPPPELVGGEAIT
jgi:hypothetical protein